MRKLLLVLVLLGAVSSVYAEKGEVSYIPKIKIGKSSLDLSAGGVDVYDETEKTYGIQLDALYGITENFEAGLGFSLERNEIGKEIANLIGDSESTIFYQVFLVGRYNFNNSTEFTPFIQAKAGLAFGGDDLTYREYNQSPGSTDYFENNLEFTPKSVYGISTGVEYKNVNVELGYEITKIDLDYSDNRGRSYSTDEDMETIYVAVGYRF